MNHSTIQTMWLEEGEKMMAMWPDIVRDIKEAITNLNIPDVPEWMEKVLNYNVPNGKKIRGLILIYTYKSLVPNEQLLEEDVRLVRILAWCVELMQACFIVLDDIMDRSLQRRGQPCWYRYNDIGLMAINDGIMLENAMYYLIRKHFKGKEYYVNLLETFKYNARMTIMGECLDLHLNNFQKKPNLFMMNRYNSLIKYKTAHYTYFLPVTAAMHLAGKKDPEIFKQAKIILLEIGQLFNIQDDYLVTFGDFEVYRKDINNDIQEGKCAWPIVAALQRATPEQRKTLEECYGVLDLEKVRCVKQIFIDLDLPSVYSIYEKEKYDVIIAHIQQMSSGLLQSLFYDLLKNIYRRKS